MKKLRTLILVVVGTHWAVAMWHLGIAAEVLPAPNNHISALAVVLLSLLHLAVAVALWTVPDKLTGWIALLFFLAAMGADLYEHFLHPSGNNVFMVPPGDWTAWFSISVFILIALEIAGCSAGVLSLSGRRSAKAA